MQEIAFFDVTRTGELLNRLSEDTQVIKNAATTNLSETLRSLATAVIGLAFMFHTSWNLTCGWFSALVLETFTCPFSSQEVFLIVTFRIVLDSLVLPVDVNSSSFVFSYFHVQCVCVCNLAIRLQYKDCGKRSGLLLMWVHSGSEIWLP